MSARIVTAHHPDSAHACVVRAITCVVYRIGLKETAILLGMSESQMGRRIKAAHVSAWPHGDILALKKRERDEFDTRELHDAEDRALYGEADGEAANAAEHVTRGVGMHGEIIALSARILEGGITYKDRADINTLSIKLHKSHEADRQALASLRARLDGYGKRRHA